MTTTGAGWVAVVVFAADWLLRLGLSARVIFRRRPVGTTMAWLMVILAFPFVGAGVYLLFGELRLGDRRAKWAKVIHPEFRRWLNGLRDRQTAAGPDLGDEFAPLSKLIETAVGIPALPGNELTLLDGADAIFPALVADIDAARSTCHLEFYIWSEGGRVDGVAEALLRARARGVVCRVLVDAVGSKRFLRGEWVRRLREGGVHVVASLPVALYRMLFVRFDLRLHRKIVVIDGEVAYTGSFNLADPNFFKKGAGVGEWVDAMARMRGPAVEALAITLLEDWELDAAEGVEHLRRHGDVHPVAARGPSAVQVVPSGPTVESDAIQAVLVTALYTARRELVLTTPYFVPEESMLAALSSAALRGVDVTLVVPAEVDSLLVGLASRSHEGDLLEAGVKVMLFRGGLLHTKSVTADGRLALFGSLNLDPRSLHLNYEITMAVYDPAFASQLRALQQSYIERSVPMDLAAWRSRSRARQFAEDAARLVGPLL